MPQEFDSQQALGCTGKRRPTPAPPAIPGPMTQPPGLSGVNGPMSRSRVVHPFATADRVALSGSFPFTDRLPAMKVIRGEPSR
jgi:hypothetical protein